MPGYRILVVDDQLHISRILKRSLQARGYQVESCQNGEEALDWLQESEFDIVLTDYQMPRMDGKMLCETIRREHDDKVALLILSTAVADEALSDWALQFRDTLYLEKPVSVRRLCALVDDHFADDQPVSAVAEQ